MPEPTPTSQFEDEIRAAARTPDARPEFVNRLQSLLLQQATVHGMSPAGDQRLESLKHRPFFLRSAWAAVLFLVVALATGILVIGPQRIASAFGSLFGWLPDIGLVQNNGALRLLANPVTVERAGITLTVQQGAADPTHTVLIYQAEGLSLKAANSQGELAPIGGPMVLLLPDGSFLSMSEARMRGWGTGYQTRLEFPALPAGVSEATLLIYRLETMPAGAAPEDWRISLKFTPAPADLKVMPVYELSGAAAGETPSSVTAVTDSTPAAGFTPGPAHTAATSPSLTNQSSAKGITLSLDKVIEEANGYQLQGSATWDTQQYTSVIVDLFAAGEHLTDSQGREIPYEMTAEGARSTGVKAIWALRTNNKAFPGPWTLTIPTLQVMQEIQPGPASFQVDFGSDPQIGQTWQLDQELDLAGNKLHLVSASLEKDTRTQNPKVNFAFEAAQEVVDLHGVIDPANTPSSGGSSSVPGSFTVYIVYNKIPTGFHSIQINAISYYLTGPWQVSWDAPATGLPVPTQAPEACFSDQKWQELRNLTGASLPTGVSGRLLIETNNGQLMPQLTVLEPDGSRRQEIAIGGWSSLSPDGSTVAFIKSDGPSLFLADVARGEIRPLPNSTPEDYHPVWSPDGQWLAFVRSLEGIYVIHPDGSGLKQILDYTGVPSVVGFLPDNRRLAVTILGAAGSQLRLVDIISGEVENLFTIDSAKGGSGLLSPDGTRLAFNEKVFGWRSGIYVAALDGSNKRLVADLESGAVSVTAWSPDGKWLVLSVAQADGAKVIETPLLLNLDTCQAHLLPGLSGRITSWSSLQP